MMPPNMKKATLGGTHGLKMMLFRDNKATELNATYRDLTENLPLFD